MGLINRINKLWCAIVCIQYYLDLLDTSGYFLDVLTRVGNILENVALIPPSIFEGFWGWPSKNPQSKPSFSPRNFGPQPQKQCPHSHLEFWGFLRKRKKFSQNSHLKKPQRFLRIFESFREFSRISQKTWKIFENFREFLKKPKRFSRIPQTGSLILKILPSTSKPLPSFSPRILRVFEGHPQKPSKANPHSHLEILTLNLKNIALILTSNFEGFWGSPSKTLKIFKPLSPHSHLKIWEFLRVTLKNPQTLRMRMRILV